MTVAEFKSRFSHVLAVVARGESVAITYGRSKKTVAIIQPPLSTQHDKRPLGLLKKKGAFTIKDDFELDDREFLRS